MMEVVKFFSDMFPSILTLIGGYALLERRLTRLETKVDIIIQDRRDEKKAGH